MAQKLTDRAALDPLLANGWALVDGRDALEKTYTFANFIDAFSWMTRAPSPGMVQRVQDRARYADHA